MFGNESDLFCSATNLIMLSKIFDGAFSGSYFLFNYSDGVGSSLLHFLFRRRHK